MRFQILGPIRVAADGREVAITAGKERTMLAMLLLHANQPVSADLLVNAIWTTEVPRNVRNQLQTCVYRLRKRLGEAGSDQPPIVAEPAGYQINVDPEDIDLYEFRRLVGEARAAGSHHDAKVAYRTALNLWRGPALAGIDSNPIRSAAVALEEERVRALEECLDSELAAGGGGELVAELTDLVARQPHREGLHRALMLALYRAGRQADALTAYRHARELFHDDLGTEPSAELQQLHHAILNRDPALNAMQPSGPAAAPAPPKPRELPPDVAGFTGRVDALKTLDELQPPEDDPTSPVVISAIAGTAGVGKTALAVHWAHRVAERFPGGQLYLNLRGYATGTPVRPIEALSMMLRSLGTPPDQIPVDKAEASARYRSLLADRQVLVVLDNARSVDQVRPLLPGGSGCLALVTSRDRLAGLVARDGAHRITLDVLPADEAHALLNRLLGNKRVADEPEATAHLASACAYLPLALRIAAAALADRPSQRIQDFVSDLNGGHRLAALEVEGDRETAVRATLDLSYRAVPEPAQRVFRLLGLVPGPDFTPDAVAALADMPPDETKRLLDRLANAHLVEEHLPDRYTFHDLLRDYAEYCSEVESRDDRCLPLERLLSWYLSTTDAASRLLRPTGTRLPLPADLAKQPAFPLANEHDAFAYLSSERANLVAAVLHAAKHGRGRYAWLLGDRLRDYFGRRAGIDALTVGRASLQAAELEGSLRDQAAAHITLADANLSLTDHQQAAAHYARASALAEQVGWLEGQATAENNLALAELDAARLQAAATHLTRAYNLNESLGRLASQASNLGNLGFVRFALGDLRQAHGLWLDALTKNREVGNRMGEAISHANLGNAHRLLGQLDSAKRHLMQAIRLHDETGDRTGKVYAMRVLARVFCDAGETAEALKHASEAFSLIHGSREAGEEAHVANALAAAYQGLGRNHDAATQLEHALDIGGSKPSSLCETLVGQAVVQRLLGNVELASDYGLRAISVARGKGYRVCEGQALTALAQVSLSQDHPTSARRYAEEAMDNHRSTGHRLGEAETLVVLGRLQLIESDPAAARRQWEAAREVFEEIGSPVPADVLEGLRRA